MKRKITIWSIVFILIAAAAWWSLPAWLSQPEDDWAIAPAASPVSTKENSTFESSVVPDAEAIIEQPETVNELLGEPVLIEEATDTKTNDIIETGGIEPSFTPPVIPQSGELEFRVRGKVQGRERYTFTRLEDGGMQAYAEGKFYFEIAYIPLELDYRQLLLLNEGLVPVQYKTQLRGPLGLGNSDTNIDFGPEQAVMVSNGKETIIPLDTHDMLAINMFATFSLLTQWFEVGQPEATFMALDAGGFEDNENLSDGGYRFGDMKLVRLDDISVQAGDRQIQTQRYVITIDGPQDGFQLLFHEDHWVGMWGEATDEAGGYFTVHRTDLFPDGFEVITN